MLFISFCEEALRIYFSSPDFSNITKAICELTKANYLLANNITPASILLHILNQLDMYMCCVRICPKHQIALNKKGASVQMPPMRFRFMLLQKVTINFKR